MRTLLKEQREEIMKQYDIVKCDECNSKATHIQEPNPYVEEIYGEVKLCNLCEEHYQQSLSDI